MPPLTKVYDIKKNPDLIEKIIKLGDSNSKTLGFFPKEAFKNAANKRNIIISIEEDKLLGYLIFNVNRMQRTKIVHLCVSPDSRGQKVPEELFSKLKDITIDISRGITLNCRRDYYHANKLWPRLGFSARAEKPGRSKYGSILTIWFYDYYKPNLFTHHDDEDTRVRAVIDVNILLDIFQNDEMFPASLSLSSDWLTDEVKLCIAPETFNELNKQENEEKRNKGKIFAGSYSVIKQDAKSTKRLYDELLILLKGRKVKSPDIMQLSQSIDANCEFFVTRDKGIIGVRDIIQERFEILIITPTELIVEIDELRNVQKYQPNRFGSTKFQINPASSKQIEKLLDVFRYDDEKKFLLKSKLDKILASPEKSELLIISEGENLFGLIGKQVEEETSEISILRISKRVKYVNTFCTYLITFIKRITEKSDYTIISENRLHEQLLVTLKEAYFLKFNDEWVKISLSEIGSLEYLEKKHLEKIKKFQNEDDEESINFNSRQSVELSIFEKVSLEKQFSPFKLDDNSIPCYIISIQSVWAKNLFDEELGKQELFSTEANLIFTNENIYYRSSAGEIKYPSRVMWYVSDSSHVGTKAIRAISYIEFVEKGRAKSLFKKYQRFGTYKWENIKGMTGGDKGKEIMVFQFSNTELLKNPILLEDLRLEYSNYTEKNINLQSPTEIENNLFLTLYKKGIK